MNFGVGDYILMNNKGYEETGIFVGRIADFRGDGCYIHEVVASTGELSELSINNYFTDYMMKDYFGWVVTEQIVIPTLHSLLEKPVIWEDEDEWEDLEDDNNEDD